MGQQGLLLSLAAVEFNQISWQGHSLKFKQPQLSVLVDTIIGPVHSQGMNNGKFLTVRAIV